MPLQHGRLSTEEMDHVRKYSADSAADFVVKMEHAWSMEEDSSDQPSSVYSTEQHMSDNTSESLLSLDSKHPCCLCSAAFVLVSSLELHLVSVHGEKLYMVLPGSSTPDRCDAGNCSNTDIDKEVDSYGKGKMTASKFDDRDTGHKDGKKRRQHVCDVCRKSFPTPSKLKTHKLTHNGDTDGKERMRQRVCDVCRKSFSKPSDLKRHSQIHSGFRCDVCSKGFTKAGDLTRHKRVNTGERPYKCPHFSNGFNRTSNLQLHIKSVHDSARPHGCDVCGAAFCNTGNLIRHKRIHTGKKPYLCSVCERSFTTSSYLAQHRLTHTGKKPYLCSDCGKGFANHSNLRTHHLTHSGEKPHSCPHCPAAFSQSGNLKRHIEVKHK